MLKNRKYIMHCSIYVQLIYVVLIDINIQNDDTLAKIIIVSNKLHNSWYINIIQRILKQIIFYCVQFPWLILFLWFCMSIIIFIWRRRVSQRRCLIASVSCSVVSDRTSDVYQLIEHFSKFYWNLAMVN